MRPTPGVDLASDFSPTVFAAEVAIQTLQLIVRLEEAGELADHRQQVIAGEFINKLGLFARKTGLVKAFVDFRIDGKQVVLEVDDVVFRPLGDFGVRY